MPTTPALADTAARTVDEQFLALMCSDADLLRAEFDAIIAAEWPSPPPRTPRREQRTGTPPTISTAAEALPLPEQCPDRDTPASADGSGSAHPRRGSHQPMTGKAGDRHT
jgi:hypothetical protein